MKRSGLHDEVNSSKKIKSSSTDDQLYITSLKNTSIQYNLLSECKWYCTYLDILMEYFTLTDQIELERLFRSRV